MAEGFLCSLQVINTYICVCFYNYLSDVCLSTKGPHNNMTL